MHNKYIVYDGMIIMGHVENHNQLLISGKSSDVKGGGWWHLDRNKDVITLYSFSEEFGQPEFRDVKQAIEYGYLTGFQEKFKFKFSKSVSLGDAVTHGFLIKRKR